MILMALDHVRDFFGHVAQNPTDLATTTPGLFLTRWITHLCAPTFFLLTGLGAGLSASRRSPGGLTRHLLGRGAWLIFLEIVVVRCLGFQFNFDYRVTVLTVLWAIGWSMIALALVVRLHPTLIATLGGALILLHNLLDPIPAQALGALAPLWTWLHVPGILLQTETMVVVIAYPIVPWIGVTMLGFSLAGLYRLDPALRQRRLLQAAAAMVTLFIVLRAINRYGDPAPWSHQDAPGFTLLSFLNTTKYPPSLLFLLMTLGPAFALLATLEGARTRLLRPAVLFGQVPMFYFLVHLPLIHLYAIAVCFQRLGAIHWFFESPDLGNFPYTVPPGWGFELPVVYLAWAVVVLSLYPLCRWYAQFKREHRSPWLSYL